MRYGAAYFGDDASTWSNPYAPNPASTTTAPPMVTSDASSSNVTAGSVLTSGVGLVGGLVNLFGGAQAQANANALALAQAQASAVSPAVVILLPIGGLIVVGLLLHSMHKGNKRSRTAGYKRRSRR